MHKFHQYIKPLLIIFLCSCVLSMEAKMSVIKLPVVSTQQTADLNETLQKRRSIRSFQSKELSQEQIAGLLWAAQGITASFRGYRTAPSAGALYPLELYILKKDGLWHYLPHKHTMKLLFEKDLRSKLSQAALGQSSIKQAPIDIVITGIYERVTAKYGERGIRYTHIEAGHAAQNLLLEAQALGLGAVPIGAFRDATVKTLLNLADNEMPLYIIPVGIRS
jgi:SagB-type dehydrogenase family enzyme